MGCVIVVYVNKKIYVKSFYLFFSHSIIFIISRKLKKWFKNTFFSEKSRIFAIIIIRRN